MSSTLAYLARGLRECYSLDAGVGSARSDFLQETAEVVTPKSCCPRKLRPRGQKEENHKDSTKDSRVQWNQTGHVSRMSASCQITASQDMMSTWCQIIWKAKAARLRPPGAALCKQQKATSVYLTPCTARCLCAVHVLRCAAMPRLPRTTQHRATLNSVRWLGGAACSVNLLNAPELSHDVCERGPVLGVLGPAALHQLGVLFQPWCLLAAAW
jgi:hypothetical protein